MTKYIVLETNPEAGDGGTYLGEVIGIYRGVVEADDLKQAADKFIKYAITHIFDDEVDEKFFKIRSRQKKIVCGEFGDTQYHLLKEVLR